MSFPPPLPLQLVIFDCDGVLVDSEGPSNRAVAEEVTKLGWAMDEAESMRQFVGFRLVLLRKTLADQQVGSAARQARHSPTVAAQEDPEDQERSRGRDRGLSPYLRRAGR